MPSIGGLVSLAALAVFTVRSTATSTTDRFQRVHDRKEAIAATSAQLQESDASECNSTSCFKYYNSKTKPYLIEQWPDIPWNTGEFYSGSVPIDESDLNRTLFFVFKPATNSDTDEVSRPWPEFSS
jgi:carboxypeptidase D